MDILLAEYATVMTPNLAEEGHAMLHTLKAGFQNRGHSVHMPKPRKGDANAFYIEVERLTQVCDAGLVIAPDKVLYLSLIHISEPTRRTPISYAARCVNRQRADRAD